MRKGEAAPRSGPGKPIAQLFVVSLPFDL